MGTAALVGLVAIAFWLQYELNRALKVVSDHLEALYERVDALEEKRR